MRTGNDEPITIRRAETPADYRACQEAQRKAWGIVEESYVVPIATMVGAQLHGGLVLGAFRPDGEAMGLSFAFLGRSGGRICLYSQLTGIVPGAQSLGLGSKMKQAQLVFAKSEGIPVICWAFDPMQAGNANFNLGKLGASAHRYVENMYGPRTDSLNAASTTDRLVVEWEVEPGARPVVPEFDPRSLPDLIRHDPRNGPTAVDPREAPLALLEIPEEIVAVRKANPEQAARLSEAVRRAFLIAFEQRYRAIGFVRTADRTAYLLRHEPWEAASRW